MKKIVILGCIIVVMLFSMAFTVSAADANNNEFFDFDEYAEYYSHDDGSVGVVVDLPEDWFRTLIYEKNYQGKNFVKTMNGFYIHDISVNGATLLIRPFGSNLFSGGAVGQQVRDAHFVDLRYIPQKTEILFSFFVSMGYENGFENGIVEDPEKFNAYRILYFVDENGKVVKRYNKAFKPEVIGDSDEPAFAYSCSVDLSDFAIPDNVVGLIPVFLLYDTLEANYEINYILFEQPSFRFSMTDLESDLVQNQRLQNLKTAVQSALAEQSEQLNGLNNKVDQLPDQIGDQMQNIADNEKNEANGTGNDSVDQMVQIIPDYSTGLIEGIKILATAISYEGTECKLKMPALTIPALEGVTAAPITFLKEQEIDFEIWFNRMPSEIMAVTKAMFDIAVVGFCFYELYDLISQLANGARKAEKVSK